MGCGTIGLAFGVALAARGGTVSLHDSNPARLARIAAADAGREEAALHAALTQGLADGRIHISHALARQAGSSNYVICVPTADARLEALHEAVLAVAEHACPGDGVFIRSTVPPGTTRKLAELVAQRFGKVLSFAALPDRSVEGRSFADQFAVPHLLGALDEAGTRRGQSMLAALGRVTPLPSPEAAEAAKLFGNLWRAGTFALANAFALVAEDHALDLHQILEAAGMDYPRFNPPRPGLVGGPCLPKDLGLILDTGRPQSVALFAGIQSSETEVARRVAERAIQHLARWPAPPRIAFLGLAFKGRPAVPDLRGSPALKLAEAIAAAVPTADRMGWDPSPLAAGPDGMALCATPQQAAAGSALTVIGHDHPDILALDAREITAGMAPHGLLMDLTGRLDTRGGLANDCRYWGLGRGCGEEICDG